MERRARDSNPQPPKGQLISNQPPSHSDTLRQMDYPTRFTVFGKAGITRRWINAAHLPRL